MESVRKDIECFRSEGVFADDEGPAEDARWWCRPTLIRAKVGLKGGGRFIPESIDDFSSCGALSTTIATVHVCGVCPVYRGGMYLCMSSLMPDPLADQAQY